jgi:hypothetical protein
MHQLLVSSANDRVIKYRLITCYGHDFALKQESFNLTKYLVIFLTTRAKVGFPYKEACLEQTRNSAPRGMLEPYLVCILQSLLINCRYLSGGVVKILVGPEAVEFDVHRVLLCARFTYFSKALSGPWQESSGSIKLPEDNADLFRFLLQWLYKEGLDHTKLPPPSDGIKASIRLYVLAHKLQVRPPTARFGIYSCPAFLNVVQRELRDSNSTLTCDEVDFIYENTLASSPLRQFAVHLSAYSFHKLGIQVENCRQSFENTPDFAMDLCRRMINPWTPLERIQDPRGLPDVCSFDYKPLGRSIEASSFFQNSRLPSDPAASVVLGGVWSTTTPFRGLVPNPATSAAQNEVFQNIFTLPEYKRSSPEVSRCKYGIGLAATDLP